MKKYFFLLIIIFFTTLCAFAQEVKYSEKVSRPFNQKYFFRHVNGGEKIAAWVFPLDSIVQGKLHHDGTTSPILDPDELIANLQEHHDFLLKVTKKEAKSLDLYNGYMPKKFMKFKKATPNSILLVGLTFEKGSYYVVGVGYLN